MNNTIQIPESICVIVSPVKNAIGLDLIRATAQISKSVIVRSIYVIVSSKFSIFTKNNIFFGKNELNIGGKNV